MKSPLVILREMGTPGKYGVEGQLRTADEIAELRDISAQLADYLTALDTAENKAANWIEAHTELILFGTHWLDRSITLGAEKEALALLEGLGDVAGLVLSVRDIKDRAISTFGPDSALGQAINQARPLLPPALIEGVPLPELPSLPATIIPEKVQPPEKPRRKWWQRGPLAVADQPDKTAALAQEWQEARNEITGQQSDRHYYVDSLMAWVGDTLSGDAADPAVAMEYQDPKKIAAMAGADHARALIELTLPVRRLAANYAGLVELLDEQKISAFANALPALFPAKNTEEAATLRGLLLKDYKSASFADIALTAVERREDQMLLFETALRLEPELRLKGANTPAEVLERIRRETVSADPLPRRALHLARYKLQLQEAPRDNGPTLRELFSRALSHFEAALEETLRPRSRPGASPRR
ncbi:MAG TPA: hypothetical protein VEF76_10325 [Patescibacteria group bacterium]|nr:hypothetical protein [Patescibacteria group bacterium]